MKRNDRVESTAGPGMPGTGRYGIVLRHEGTRVVVAWDDGFVTTAHESKLRLA